MASNSPISRRLLPPEIKDRVISMLEGNTSHMTVTKYARHQYSQGVFSTLQCNRPFYIIKEELLGAARGGYVDVFTTLLEQLVHFYGGEDLDDLLETLLTESWSEAQYGLLVCKRDTTKLFKYFMEVFEIPLTDGNYEDLMTSAANVGRFDVIREFETSFGISPSRLRNKLLLITLGSDHENEVISLLEQMSDEEYEDEEVFGDLPEGVLIDHAVRGGNSNNLKRVLLRNLQFLYTSDEQKQRLDTVSLDNVGAYIRDGQDDETEMLRVVFQRQLLSARTYFSRPDMFDYIFEEILGGGQRIYILGDLITSGEITVERVMNRFMSHFMEQVIIYNRNHDVARVIDHDIARVIDRWFNYLVQHHDLNPEFQEWMDENTYKKLLSSAASLKDHMETFIWLYSKWTNDFVNNIWMDREFRQKIFVSAVQSGNSASVRVVLKEFDRVYEQPDQKMIEEALPMSAGDHDMVTYLLSIGDSVLPKPFVPSRRTVVRWGTSVDASRPLLDYIRLSFGPDVDGYKRNMYELYSIFVKYNRWEIARYIHTTLVPIPDEVWRSLIHDVSDDVESVLFLAFEFGEDRLQEALQQLSGEGLNEVKEKLGYMKVSRSISGVFRSLGKRVDSLESRILTTLGTLALAVFAIR